MAPTCSDGAAKRQMNIERHTNLAIPYCEKVRSEHVSHGSKAKLESAIIRHPGPCKHKHYIIGATTGTDAQYY